MYAGMNVYYHEITKTKISAANTASLPVFMSVFSSDKGPEKITQLTADDFYTLYGKKADFSKYGQPLTQAHAILNAGGIVMGYRIVSDTATFGNAILTATVTTTAVQKVDSNGNKLYLDASGVESTTVSETPATYNVATIKYGIKTVTNVTTFKTVTDAADAMVTTTTTEYPLLVIADNGRGASIKSFKIVGENALSKNLTYCIYSICDIESNAIVETTRFSMDPDATYTYNGNTRSMNLIENTTNQFKTYMCTKGIAAFVKKLSEITSYTEDTLYASDFLFGKTAGGTTLSAIAVDNTNGVTINTSYGIALQSGTNGDFDDAPFPGSTGATDAWTAKAVKFLSGELTDEIYDLDLYKIDFICDANYPKAVKSAIATLVKFRQDAMYFRDMGLNIDSYTDVETTASDDAWVKSPFIADYFTNYDIIDSTSKKQVKVTMMHGFAPLLVAHYTNSPASPLSGEYNGFVITEALPGTMSFVPRVTPTVNQKTLLDNLRINYANYVDTNQERLVVQSEYTSQDHYGSLSYINNIVITQMAVKAVRTYCPKIRFQQLSTTADFSAQKQLIEDNVLSKYNSYFKSISLVYTKDDDMMEQKIFNASIECYYKDFYQSELFDVYAIEGSPDDSSTDYTSNVIDI